MSGDYGVADDDNGPKGYREQKLGDEKNRKKLSSSPHPHNGR